MRISDWISDVCSSDLDGCEAVTDRDSMVDIRGITQSAPQKSCTNYASCTTIERPSANPVMLFQWPGRLRSRKASAGSWPAFWCFTPARHSATGARYCLTPVWWGKPIIPGTDSISTRPGYGVRRSVEHTSELQSLMRISYAVFCLKKTIHIKA